LLNRPGGGRVESVLTCATQRLFLMYFPFDLVLGMSLRPQSTPTPAHPHACLSNPIFSQ
jgi:hypothetical protein